MTYIATGPQTYTNILSGTGVDPTGATDSTTGIATVRSAVSAAGGGVVYWPPGTYITGNQPIYSNVLDLGAGIGATTIKLKNGANTDLFSAYTSSINLSAAWGAGSTTGAVSWGISNMILDGNKANQTAGPSYPLRVYGCGYILENLRIKNGYSGGILSDWNAGLPSTHDMETQLVDVKAYDCNGIGIQWGGPSDAQWTQVLAFLTGSHNIHITPNAGGILGMNIHTWTPGAGAVGMLVEAAGCHFVNGEFESSDTANLVLLAGEGSFHGRVFGTTGAFACTGIQIGQAAGMTPYAGQILQAAGITTAASVMNTIIEANVTRCEGAHGAIWFANDGGGNAIKITAELTAGTGYSGSYGWTTQFDLTVSGSLVNDGSANKGGITRQGKYSYAAWQVDDGAGNRLMVIDSIDKEFRIANSTGLSFFSDSSMLTYAMKIIDGAIYMGSAFDTSIARGAAGMVAFNGGIILGQSTSAPVLASAGTIATAGLGISRVAPSGAVTGIILADGTVAGQTVTVINESAFSITFATAATSNVADGTSAVIAANRKMDFTWDSGPSRWYHS